MICVLSTWANNFDRLRCTPRQAAPPQPDRSPIYEWARKHIVLPESYATPGPFNARITPWLIPIFDALQNPLVRRVHFRKAVQIGGTLVADIWIPWIIANDAGPISWTMQTEEMTERHAKSRLNPLLERCRPVAAMLPRPGPHRMTTEIYFGGFFPSDECGFALVAAVAIDPV